MKKLSFMKSRKFVTYVKKELSTDKNDENTFKNTIKSEIIVITRENLKELLIKFAI